MIIADTGFWLALANRADQHHVQARAAAKTLDEPLVTTWPVVSETCHLLITRLGVDAELAFLHPPRALELMTKYRDLPMDLADASLVILAEALGHGRILSTERRDFQTYRWKDRHPFKNVLSLS
jgi:predicted nucleic acid-binding protein